MDWERIVQKYQVGHSDKIRRATRPLRERFGIGYFTYHKIDRQGKYTVLVDRPDWAEHYVGEKFYLDDPFLSQPEAFSSGISLLQIREGEENRILKAGKEKFGLDLGALLIEKGEEGVEFFGFCGSRKESALEKLYLNHPSLMRAFGRHFKKEMAKELLAMQIEAGSLKDLKGKTYFRKAPVEPDLPKEELLAFLDDLKIGAPGFGLLSRRERECVALLLKGMSARETARELGLSPRTVECYFETIKAKLSCQTKQEVFSTALSMKELDFLP